MFIKIKNNYFVTKQDLIPKPEFLSILTLCEGAHTFAIKRRLSTNINADDN